MAKQPKTKNPEDIAEISIDKHLLLSAMGMTRQFSECPVVSTNITVTKNGIAMFGLNAEHYAGAIILLSKKACNEYRVKEDFKRKLTADILQKMKSFASCNETAELQIIFTDEKIKLKMGNLRKTIDWKENPEYEGAAEKILKTVQAITKKADIIGRIKLEELTLYMQNASRSKGERDREMTFVMTQKKLIIKTKFDQTDTLEIELKDEIENPSEAMLKATFPVNDIAIMIEKARKLTDTITIIGETDAPLIISKEGSSAENAMKFEEKLEFYLLLAPRV